MPEPEEIILTSDLDPTYFGVTDDDPKAITITPDAFTIPRYQLSGAIEDYENQSGRQEFVWYGGTQYEPDCIWLVGSDNSYTKWKSADTGSETFCEDVESCISDNLALGDGTPDKYRVPEMDGPVWQVDSLTHAQPEETIDFSSDSGSDLATLVDALNDSANLPENWEFTIEASALTLCVPHGTYIDTFTLAGGETVDFNGVPTTEGTGPSSLVAEIGQQLNATGFELTEGGNKTSTETDEGSIETEYALIESATVRWVDADGDNRISYKDPVNGWYHPVKKVFDKVLVREIGSVFAGSRPEVDSDLETLNATTLANVPVDAKTVHIIIESDVVADDGNAGASSTLTQIKDDGINNHLSSICYAWSSGSDAHDSRDTAVDQMPQAPVYTVGGSAVIYISYSYIAAATNHEINIKIYVAGWER